jgi:chromosome segregation ATPase
MKSLEIKNFQAHKDTLIDFHPGVTYLIGDNDAGKSAIMRSLRWVVKNSPTGFSFKSHFADKKENTSVALNFEDETVTRERGSSINQYRVGSEEYKALASKVPEDIAELINLDEINLQSQYAPYFLLCETPGKVAEKFNEVFNLQKIDSSSGNIKKVINKASADSTHASEESKKLIKNIENLSWIDDFASKLAVLENKETNKNEKIEIIKKADNVLLKIKTIEAELVDSKKVLAIEGMYLEIVQKEKELNILKEKVNSVSKIVSSIETINRQLVDVQKIIQYEDDVDALISTLEKNNKIKEQIKIIEKVTQDIITIQKQIEENKVQYEGIVDDLLEKSKQVEEITTKGKKIADVVREIIKVRAKIKAGIESTKKNKLKYEKMLKDLGVCPLCGKKI